MGVLCGQLKLNVLLLLNEIKFNAKKTFYMNAELTKLGKASERIQQDPTLSHEMDVKISSTR